MPCYGVCYGQAPRVSVDGRSFGRAALMTEVQETFKIMGGLDPAETGARAALLSKLEAAVLECTSLAAALEHVDIQASRADLPIKGALERAVIADAATPLSHISCIYAKMLSLARRPKKKDGRARSLKDLMGAGANQEAGLPDIPKGFFHVAIDCPGYGQSEGSMTSVRKKPRALLADVIRS
jgi:hypothetical protein